MEPIDWNTGHKQGLFPISSHKLYLEATGPDRNPGEPVVLIIQGLGSTSSAWATVVRLLQPFVRVVIYDRSGLGQSDCSPLPPTSVNIVRELRELLLLSRIGPPYVVVAHSWGGVLAQEFSYDNPSQIGGLVLVDANNRWTLERLDWRPFMTFITSNGIDVSAGLNMEIRHNMLESEWLQSQVDAASPKTKLQAAKDFEAYQQSFSRLASIEVAHQGPPLLERKPLAIVVGSNGLDMKMLFEAVVKEGFGTFDQLTFYEKFVADFSTTDFATQCEAKSLSANFWVHRGPDNSGHNIHMTEPAMLVGIIKRTFKMVI